MLIKVLVHQEEITIINMWAPKKMFMDQTANNIKMSVPPKTIHRISTVFIKGFEFKGQFFYFCLFYKYRKPHLKIHVELPWAQW